MAKQRKGGGGSERSPKKKKGQEGPISETGEESTGQPHEDVGGSSASSEDAGPDE